MKADPPGFEPGVFGLEVRRPIQARLRAPHKPHLIIIFFLLFIFN